MQGQITKVLIYATYINIVSSNGQDITQKQNSLFPYDKHE